MVTENLPHFECQKKKTKQNKTKQNKKHTMLCATKRKLTTSNESLKVYKKGQFEKFNGAQLAKMKKSIPDMSLP